MMSLRALYHLMWADFLERIRRYSFFVTLVFSMLAAYLYLPARNAGYKTLNFGEYRGVYNSAWVGMQIAVLAAAWLPIVGFYIVKNTIERDGQTGVGQIIAATPLNKACYTLGKMLSNFAVLAAMVGATAVVAGSMQLIRGEDIHLDLWALLSPFLFITLPAVALAAALAVLFETISWLRGSLGNIIYFLLSTTGMLAGQGKALDPFGISIPLRQIGLILQSTFPDFSGEASVGLTMDDKPNSTGVFVWHGMHWTDDILLQRLLWLAIAFAIALLASLFFTRFDPARGSNQRKRSPTMTPGDQMDELVMAVSEAAQLTPLARTTHHQCWTTVLSGELRLLLQRLSPWWYAGALIVNILMVLLPVTASYAMLYPLASIWPLFIWSGLGNREVRFQTHHLVFSTAHPLVRQLPMHWLAGVLCTLLVTAGIAIRLIITGNMGELLLFGVGTLFIPSLALAAGIWVGNGRLFEVLYLIWWYAGPVNHVPVLDLLAAGTIRAGAVTQLATGYLLVTLLLLVLALVGRMRQLHVA